MRNVLISDSQASDRSDRLKRWADETVGRFPCVCGGSLMEPNFRTVVEVQADAGVFLWGIQP
jgi:hypothetical protein